MVLLSAWIIWLEILSIERIRNTHCQGVNMILFSLKDSPLACVCCFGCGRLSAGCILKPLWSCPNCSQAGYWAASAIVSELLRILGVLLCLSFDSTTHTPWMVHPVFCFKLGFIIVNCKNFRWRLIYPCPLFFFPQTNQEKPEPKLSTLQTLGLSCTNGD